MEAAEAFGQDTEKEVINRISFQNPGENLVKQYIQKSRTNLN